MGVYQIIQIGCINLQAKVLPEQNIYKIGDEIQLPDGVYHTYEGWFVVQKEKVIVGGENSFDKYGNDIVEEIRKAIDKSNPFCIAFKEISEGK